MSQNRSENVANVVSLAQFKQKKDVEKELSQGRTPLYVSHLNSEITGSSKASHQEKEDFGVRLQRIKSSLERINFLMSELKKKTKE